MTWASFRIALTPEEHESVLHEAHLHGCTVARYLLARALGRRLVRQRDRDIRDAVILLNKYREELWELRKLLVASGQARPSAAVEAIDSTVAWLQKVSRELLEQVD